MVVIGGGNVAIDVARSALRAAAETMAARSPASNELTSSEMDVAMKEFMDVSRAALRMGAREVQLVCLESRAEMPASEEEIEEGLLEGLKIHPSLRPEAVRRQEWKTDGARRRSTAFRYSTSTSASIRSSSRERNS